MTYHQNDIPRYKTFKRTANNFTEFARARKFVQDIGLTYDEAVRQCRNFNDNRTPAQIRKGTKMEFARQ